MYKCTLFLLSLSMAQISAFAQQDELMGRVLDSNSKQPIAFASLKSGYQQSITDKEGAFKIKAKMGETIVISHIGFLFPTNLSKLPCIGVRKQERQLKNYFEPN